MAGRCPTIVVLLQDDLPMVRLASSLLTMSGHLSGRCPSKKSEKQAQEQKRADANPTNSEKKRKFAHKFYI